MGLFLPLPQADLHEEEGGDNEFTFRVGERESDSEKRQSNGDLKKEKDNILSLFDFVRNIQINEMEEIFERGKKRNFMERERERAKR